MASTSATSTYTDYSQMTEEASENSALSVASADQASPNFAMRLHYMISDLENEGNLEFVAWQPHGRAFQVCNKKGVGEKILPLWFRQNKFSSFQRQLNFYGFKRLTRGPDRGCYYHELFLRGKSFLAQQIPRVNIKGTGPRKPAAPEDEPDLYQYPTLPPASSQTMVSTEPRTAYHQAISPFLGQGTLESSMRAMQPGLPQSAGAPTLQMQSSLELSHVREPYIFPVAPASVNPFSPSRSMRPSVGGEAKRTSTELPSTPHTSSTQSLRGAMQDSADRALLDRWQMQSQLGMTLSLLQLKTPLVASFMAAQPQAQQLQPRAFPQNLLPAPPFLSASESGDQASSLLGINTDLLNLVHETVAIQQKHDELPLQHQLPTAYSLLGHLLGLPDSRTLWNPFLVHARDTVVDSPLLGTPPLPPLYRDLLYQDPIATPPMEHVRTGLLETRESRTLPSDHPTTLQDPVLEPPTLLPGSAPFVNSTGIELLRLISAQQRQRGRRTTGDVMPPTSRNENSVGDEMPR